MRQPYIASATTISYIFAYVYIYITHNHILKISCKFLLLYLFLFLCIQNLDFEFIQVSRSVVHEDSRTATKADSHLSSRLSGKEKRWTF